ncbi:SDR family NAD(P)-dependent oxidoreductase [Streptomyces griseoruber]|uniref:SDR family NAD(P)-dependent oxidoreductase n=1 Tax=Streptomyces griseoruber TaxID=1943 RepID=UPI0037B42B98
MSAMPANRPLALVTGASNGIGTEIARQLADRGYDIIGTGRGDSIDTVAERLRALGATVYALRADLATYDGVENRDLPHRRRRHSDARSHPRPCRRTLSPSRQTASRFPPPAQLARPRLR